MGTYSLDHKLYSLLYRSNYTTVIRGRSILHDLITTMSFRL